MFITSLLKNGQLYPIRFNCIQSHPMISNYIQLHSIQYVSSVSSCNFGPRTLRHCPCPIEGVPAAPTIPLPCQHLIVVSNLSLAPFQVPGRKRYPRATTGAMSCSMISKISTGRGHLALFVCDVSTTCVLDLFNLACIEFSNCNIVGHRFPSSSPVVLSTVCDTNVITTCTEFEEFFVYGLRL